MDDDHMNEDGTSGRIREKLIATKQLWAKEGRLLTGRPSNREEDGCRRASARQQTGRCSISA